MFKSKEILIPEENPFLNDSLNRKESAEALTEFVLSTNDPMVICIDAPWGQGKTTFLRMWEQHLKNKQIPTIYFNAWENDFTDDALVNLIGEIGSAFSELTKSGNESKAREYYDKAKKVGAALLKRSVPLAAKVATAGVLNLDEITEDAISSLSESLAKEQIDQYENSKKSIQSFRNSLRQFASSISDNQTKPLVFIIDELDRCRPNYSIEVLEKAKHFFNVENIVFILGADKAQLGSSIKAIYGEGLNVNGYLRRFIDFDYLLPTPPKGTYVKSLFERYNFQDYFSKRTHEELRHESSQILKMFEDLFGMYSLTLREQNQCCALLSLAIRTTPHDNRLFPLFLCLLIVLKVKTPEIYKSYIRNEIQPKELVASLKNLRGGNELLETNYGAALEAYIVTSKSEPREVDDINSEYRKIVESESSSNTQKVRASGILKIIDGFNWSGGVGVLNYLTMKIELASHFKS